MAFRVGSAMFAVLCVVTAVASPAPLNRGGWTSSTSQGDEIVRPMFMLRHAPGAVAQLEDFVAEVSAPGHPAYGKYLDMAGLRQRLPVAEGAQEAVIAFLKDHSVAETQISVSASGDMILAEVPAVVASIMFAAEFHRYDHPQSQMHIVRAANGYTIPAQIHGHVYLVGNLNEFPDVRQPIQVEVPQEGSFGRDCGWTCSGKVTPGVLASRYGFNISEGFGAGSSDTGMATAEFQGVNYDNTSLQHFQNKCGLQQKVTVDQQIGTNHGLKCKIAGSICIEALLDIEYAKAVSGSTALTNIYNRDYSLLHWAMQVDDLGDAGPAVHSISYGDDEIQQKDHAQDMSGSEYMEAVNAQLVKLAARGISVLVASGDQGVCGRSGCGPRFHPDFPASSPYVTAVGGTDFVAKGVIGEEQAWSESGGGFSDEFARPAWQDAVVDGYLAAAAEAGTLPKDAAFNRTGRAYPDVAALGGTRNPYCVALEWGMLGVSGTSASCPVFAATIARLNVARLSKGLPRMGFLNPWLYQHPDVFHDVSLGSNGFTAMAGWDPTTGLGTPDFEKMLRAAVAVEEKDAIVV